MIKIQKYVNVVESHFRENNDLINIVLIAVLQKLIIKEFVEMEKMLMVSV